jgi:hypothetical protein
MRWITPTLVALVVLLAATTADAQSLAKGVRMGVSSDPDQFYFGGHVETRALIDRLHFRPNAEIGIGDNITTIALNFEFAYKFPAARRAWDVYALGGPALNIYNFNDDTHSRGGFNLGLGIEHDQGLFGELKIGAIDSPDFKLGIGYRF